MSYEGYLQCICENGHYFERNVENGGPCLCGSPAAWTNEVDQTNCDENGVIKFSVIEEKFLDTPDRVEVCDLGHPHVTRDAVFRIPTKAETDPLREYFDSEIGDYVSLCASHALLPR